MDVVAQRERIARWRAAARRVPGLWRLYGSYWHLRTAIEARRRWPTGSHAVMDFGHVEPPTLAQPQSQLCTSAQFLEPAYRHWCSELDSPARFARKQWEFAYILQVLRTRGMLRAGARGLGFGCGREPLVGILARYGCEVMATDLAFEHAREQGWVNTLQHASSQDSLYEAARDYVERTSFDRLVRFRVVDMNEVPPDLHGAYDFVWSACAFEHLGSLERGLAFVRAAARCLRPGGVAVHTTEFNLSSDNTTFESPSCSIYRRRDIEGLFEQLRSDGLEPFSLNLHTGDGPVDRHVDVPPYGFSPHIKLLLEGQIVTSIGIGMIRPL